MKNQVQKVRETAFLEECNDLCDVSLVDALDKITDDDVKNFLIMQRKKGRPGSMSNILAKKQQRGTTFGPTTTTGATISTSSGTVDTSTSVRSSTGTVDNSAQDLTGSLSSISLADDSRKDPDYVPDVKAPPKKKKQDLVDERIASVLDKCCISGRCAVHLFVAFLLRMKLDPREFNISYTSISKQRSTFRESIYEQVKDSVQVGRGAIVHFDGKLMSAITGKEKVDRLAVKVTYGDVDQLLGNC